MILFTCIWIERLPNDKNTKINKIDVVRDNVYIRPLLETPRTEIMSYLDENGLEFVEDEIIEGFNTKNDIKDDDKEKLTNLIEAIQQAEIAKTAKENIAAADASIAEIKASDADEDAQHFALHLSLYW